MIELFNAVAARKAVDDAQSLHGEFMKRETNDVLASIKLKAESGESYLTYAYEHKVIVARLEALGFNVKVTHDQRDGDFMNINW